MAAKIAPESHPNERKRQGAMVASIRLLHLFGLGWGARHGDWYCGEGTDEAAAIAIRHVQSP